MLGRFVEGFADTDDGICVKLKNSPTLHANMVVMAIGVAPEMITRKQEMKLISNGLRTSFSDSSGRTNQGYQMAAAFAVTMPLLIAFIFLRKYLMRGVSRSGIKG